MTYSYYFRERERESSNWHEWGKLLLIIQTLPKAHLNSWFIFHLSSSISSYLSSINPIMQHSKWVSVRTIAFQLGCWTIRQTLSLSYVGSPTPHESAWPSRCLKILAKSFANVGKLYIYYFAIRSVHGSVPLCPHLILETFSKGSIFLEKFFQVFENLEI